jgi:hypothetical protein
MSRQIQDAALTVTSNFPNAAGTVNTNAIDLGATAPFPVTERITVAIRTTAGTNAANNKNITVQLQDSDVNTSANFTNIAGVAPLIIPEVAAGYAASALNVALPPGTRQFLRAQIKCESGGGNANDGTATVKLLF